MRGEACGETDLLDEALSLEGGLDPPRFFAAPVLVTMLFNVRWNLWFWSHGRSHGNGGPRDTACTTGLTSSLRAKGRSDRRQAGPFPGSLPSYDRSRDLALTRGADARRYACLNSSPHLALVAVYRAMGQRESRRGSDSAGRGLPTTSAHPSRAHL